MANILVIDDDKDILMLMEFMLKKAGHSVSTCISARQGLSRLEAESPDLIIVDVMMPGMDGFDFCRRVRDNATLATVPIIVFSAHYQSTGRRTALEVGADEYLPKTTPPDALIRHISELLPIA